MNLLRPPVRFSGRQLFTQLSPSCWYTITHQVTQILLKQIYRSPSAWSPLHGFFKSISWITSSSARLWSAVGVSSVSRKQDFCNNESRRTFQPSTKRRYDRFRFGEEQYYWV